MIEYGRGGEIHLAESEYAEMKKQKPGMTARYYKSFAKLKIDSEESDAPLVADLARAEADLKSILGGYAGFPAGGQEALIDMAFNLGKLPRRDVLSRARRRGLVVGQRVPGESEVAACGPIVKKIRKTDPEFATLVRCDNAANRFKDEDGTGADRMMSSRLRDAHDKPAAKIGSEWPRCAGKWSGVPESHS
jgi:hypothetical protein